MRFLRFFINKYVVVTAAFASWMLFFDANDYHSQHERDKELNNVNADISFLNTEIDDMQRDYTALQRDPKMLEHYAREQYRMKRDTEDLYVIEPK